VPRLYPPRHADGMRARLEHMLSLGGGVLRSTGIYALTSAFSRLCAFGALPFLSSHISSAEYGTIGLLMTSGWVMRSVANMGISSAMPASYFEHDAPGRITLVSTATALTLPLLALMLVAAGAAATPLSMAITGAPGFEWPLLGFIASVALLAATSPMQTQQALDNRAIAYSVPQVVGGVISLLGAIVGVMHLGLGVRGWVYASMASAVVQSALVFMLVDHRWDRLIDWPTARVLMRNGVPMLPLTFLVFGLQTTPLFLTRGLGNMEATGAFAYALNFALALQIVGGAVSNAWPAFFMRFRERPAAGAQAFHTFSVAILGFQGVAAIGICVVGALVVQFFATPALQQASSLVGWLCFAQFCATAVYLPQPAYYFVGQIYWITLAFLAALPLQVGCLIVGFHLLGPTGTAIASAAGSAFVAVALAAFASRRDWPGADKRWARWCARGLFLAVLIAAGTVASAFDNAGPTLAWGATVVALWLLSMRGELPRIRSALRGQPR
jgi:O-antigen/teichoic acid export membrane protein